MLMPMFIFRFIEGCDVPVKPDTTPPKVHIVEPHDGDAVSGRIEIKCRAVDDRGMSHVELWVDGAFTGVADSTEPYALLWNTMRYENNSTHVITVRAYDTSKNKADSEPINLTIDNTQDLPPAPSRIYEIVYQDNSFKIRWSRCPDPDFKSYTLFESYSDDMSGEQRIFRSEDKLDTSFVVTGVNSGEVRYYQVEVADSAGLTSRGNISEASSVQNMALYFDGQNDMVKLGYTVANNVRSIEFWFKLGRNVNFSLSETIGLIARNCEDERNEFGFFFHQTGWRHPGHLEFFRKVGDDFHYVYSDQNKWVQDVWFHVAATIDPDRGMFLYINGERQNSYDYSLQPIKEDDHLVSIGQWGDMRFRHFTGFIYEVRFWKRALDESEIIQNMHSHLTGDEYGLSTYYRFDEGRGQMIKDFCTNSEIYLGSSAGEDSDDPTWTNTDLPF
ncbi:MAG: hypothetical protein GF353_07780 [Candidatus Lokiarchaeota archaeon]|nr:hypothetical protein [Candidatus Lokiarchaeota archaeon]